MFTLKSYTLKSIYLVSKSEHLTCILPSKIIYLKYRTISLHTDIIADKIPVNRIPTTLLPPVEQVTSLFLYNAGFISVSFSRSSALPSVGCSTWRRRTFETPSEWPEQSCCTFALAALPIRTAEKCQLLIIFNEANLMRRTTNRLGAFNENFRFSQLKLVAGEVRRMADDLKIYNYSLSSFFLTKIKMYTSQPFLALPL